MGRLWRVVGGEKGGLLVREGRELNSAEKQERLANQSIVEEVETVGARFCYRIRRGVGPETGWISMKLKDKLLIVPADTRETGKQFDTKAPLPELLCVQPSTKHGTSRGVLATLDELEQKAWKQVKEANASTNGKDVLESRLAPFRSTVEDLLHMAWKRENRKRVILFLANMLQSCSQNRWNLSARLICHQLCLVSWASSMVDVEYYDFTSEDSKTPLVILCGFGGSHLDDLQPAIEQWTGRFGAAVLAFGPAVVGREDMLDLIYSKLMEAISRVENIGYCTSFTDNLFYAFVLIGVLGATLRC